jgi:hypothetical protein
MPSESPTGVPIVCEECGTEARVPLEELAHRLTKHNEAQHDGEKYAQVDPDVADQLANLIAKDMGLFEEEEV